MQETIILLTGTPSAGKTTIAETLSRTFTQSAHVSVDFFRKQIKAGYASPHHWNDEVERQYRLARKNAALTAKNIYPFPQNTKSSPVEARLIAPNTPRHRPTSAHMNANRPRITLPMNKRKQEEGSDHTRAPVKENKTRLPVSNGQSKRDQTT